ncbi:MAG: FAD:protein FMN transferase [Clostridia bacterium]|nr:FAD:protein FMN transferase [Clostridia bacterium]
MKKGLTLGTVLIFAVLCSCASPQSTATEIYFDTAVTLTADCSEEVLSGAFSLCADYEKKLSRTKDDSEVSLLRAGKSKVCDETLSVIRKGLYYSELSHGKFDITAAALTDIWDYKNEVIPTKDEIAEALKSVDYGSVSISGNEVDTGGRAIDLGAVAKGYIADKLLEYFKANNTKSGIINLGGNVTVFGDKYYTVGIKKPFGDGELSATLRLKNKSVSTSGIYERCFEKDGVLYHHILDTATGYPADTDILSASVIGDCSADCDALGTVCVLYGLDKAQELIENTAGFEAVFIDKDYRIHITGGLRSVNGVIELK